MGEISARRSRRRNRRKQSTALGGRAHCHALPARLDDAVFEISAGNFNSQGQFVDLVKHTAGQAQTATQASSVDSWHTAEDIISNRIQTGFDLFFTSGYTNHLPAMIPIAMIYATPEDSAAELAYIEKRGYPISYVEMGEEPD